MDDTRGEDIADDKTMGVMDILLSLTLIIRNARAVYDLSDL